MDNRQISLFIFILSYLLFIFLPKRRTLIAITSALILILFRIIPLKEAFLSINWNVLGIFMGTLLVADIFMESRMPAYIAERLVNRSKNTCWAILYLCILTGIISAFVENVATVLIVSPIAFSLAKKLEINPTKMIIAISISSNLQGTATLIGDPPSMLLAGFAKLNFMDFFFYKGKPSIFFAVELGAIFSFLVLYFFFRKEKKKTSLSLTEEIHSWVPTWILILLILSLAISSFIDVNFSYLAGLICLFFGIISLIWRKVFNRYSLIEGLKSLDWETSLFLIGIFILVGTITINGWIDFLADRLSLFIKGNVFLGYSVLVFVSVFFSAFVDNVPFLVAMLPVATSLSERLHIDPTLFLFGLLIGTSLGGNITPIGASANIVACGLLKKEGFLVKFKDFVKIGLPFTLFAVVSSSLFVWFIWR